MRTLHALAPLAFASSALSAAVKTDTCADLWTTAPSLLPDLEVYKAEKISGNFCDPEYQSVAYPAAVPELPSLCRFGAWIHTSNRTKVQFEVFMPDDWSGRFAMVGNGGDAGGVNFPDMGIPVIKYKFAVASTDTGHWGTSGDGTFAAGNPESQIDFGHRAVHLTAEYSKKIIKAYYGKEQKKSYWLGCSSGGKQGLKEVQAYPEDFDGVIAGAAAAYWQRLNAATYRYNAFVNVVDTPGYLNTSDYAVIGAHVLSQCDELDGVKDSIIADPDKCHPDLAPILCSSPGANSSACISEAQALTMERIWADYHAQNGTWIAPGFKHGAEGLPGFSVNGSPYGPAPDYWNYQVQNNTNTSAPFVVANETAFEALINESLFTDPGQTFAADPNIEPFLSRGKLITYVGGSDTLIPSGFTLRYWHEVQAALGWKDLSSSYRLFEIPGMGHCSGGPGAYNFGGPGQRQISLGGSGQSTTFDEEHDMVLAMIAWVEQGKAPSHLIGSKFKGDDYRNGTAFQRKFCPYPQQAVYVGGDTNYADSFECRYT
ncbi:hypothetical protein JCM10213_002042 [Rhodosporidiobolus nylandii]